MSNQSILPITQYGTQLIPSSNLALLRGTGNYNPAPNYESTINRGPAYSQSLNYYQNFSDQQPGPLEPQPSLTDMSQEFKAVYPSDVENLRKYEVGTSQFHPEANDSWNRPDAYSGFGSDQYQSWAIHSMNLQPNALLNFFFSTDNVDYLQTRMQDEVLRIRQVSIAKQSVDELLIIMRNKYLYALSGWLNHPGTVETHSRGPVTRDGLAYYEGGLEQQIELLNKSVLEECLKQILSGISMYQQFYKDAASMPMPLSRPVIASQKGSKVLQENLAFESGHEVSNAITSYNERFNIL